MIGGPWDGNWCTLRETPPRIQIGITYYRRLDDPDTGEFLGGYVLDPGPAPRTLNRTTIPRGGE